MGGSGWQGQLELAISTEYDLESYTLPLHTAVSSSNPPHHHVSPPPHPVAAQEVLDTA